MRQGFLLLADPRVALYELGSKGAIPLRDKVKGDIDEFGIG